MKTRCFFDVFSIRYDNGAAKIINRDARPRPAEKHISARPANVKKSSQPGDKKNSRQSDEKPSIPQLNEATILQDLLNDLPAAPIGSNTENLNLAVLRGLPNLAGGTSWAAL
jgi:hypothetical protein